MEVGSLQEVLSNNTKFEVFNHCTNTKILFYVIDRAITLQSVGVLLESDIIAIGNSTVWPGKY